ncbi:MAG: prenyltransferase/squalene oxidase repeat-containing protein [Planctomycetota bacterium]|jgi:hypothetical protein
MKRKPGRRRAAPPQLIQVAENNDEKQSVADWLKREARTGVPGAGVSFVLHALLLIAMAMYVLHRPRFDDRPLSLGWAVARDSQQEAPDTPPTISPIAMTPRVQPKTAPKPLESNTRRQSRHSVAPVDVSRSLSLRAKRGRQGSVDGEGDGNKVQRAMKLGLEWLVRQQKSGGNWQLHEGYPDAGYQPLRTDTGATALALLAFLGDGHTHLGGEHREIVAGGLRWLKNIQKADGDFHDFDERGRQTAYYAHSMATLAMCEAYAMTGDEQFREPVERAIGFLLRSQQPNQGGWKYMPQDVDTEGDLSVTGWGLMAMHTARMAGIDVADSEFGLTSLFLDAVASRDGALYRYQPSDSSTDATPAMTAAGLLGRQWLGWPADDRAMLEGVDWMLQPKFLPDWSGGRRNVYEWYYVAQVLHNLGGRRWKDWFGRVQALIVDNQRTRGSRRAPTDVVGSWNPTEPAGSRDEHSHIGGRLYLTVMCLLTLETPVRHAPIYASDSGTLSD